MIFSERMRAICVLLVTTLLTACAGGAKRVDCTWRLEPINAPPVKETSEERAQ
jgi:hypothetical protein